MVKEPRGSGNKATRQKVTKESGAPGETSGEVNKATISSDVEATGSRQRYQRSSILLVERERN